MFKLIKKYTYFPKEILYILVEKKDEKIVYINKRIKNKR